MADNIQQNCIFAIDACAEHDRAFAVPASEYLQVVWACALWSVIASIAFWVGYRIYPLYRAPGMAGTAYMILGIVPYVMYHLITHPFAG